PCHDSRLPRLCGQHFRSSLHLEHGPGLRTSLVPGCACHSRTSAELARGSARRTASRRLPARLIALRISKKEKSGSFSRRFSLLPCTINSPEKGSRFAAFPS